MRTYVLTHLSDAVLLRDLDALVAQERAATAAVLAHIAEVDARRLYLPAGYPSMFDYGVGKLRLSEDAAYKRIQAARAARKFPVIFAAVAEGRLHLTGVVLLSPHLRPQNADALIAAATHQTKHQIGQLLAERFPRSEMLALVEPIPGAPPLQNEQLVPEPVGVGVFTDAPVPAQALAPVPRTEVKPHAPQRFALHLTIDQGTHDLLRHAQDLLGPQIPSGDVAQVLQRALELLVRHLEKQKFAATPRPRVGSRRSSTNPRHIPAPVKRAVWERDQGQCTFVGATGQRCRSRKFLEFDHADPVARGGQATVENLSLRCRPHNQYGAECTFGIGFMSARREEARHAAAEARGRAAAASALTRAAAESDARARVAAEAEARARAAEARSCAVADEHAKDVMACLRELGFRASEARRAVEFGATLPDATLEERVRAALKFLCPKTGFHGRVGTSLEART